MIVKIDGSFAALVVSLLYPVRANGGGDLPMVPAPTDDRESRLPLTVCPGPYQRHLVVAPHHDTITLRCSDPGGDHSPSPSVH